MQTSVSPNALQHTLENAVQCFHAGNLSEAGMFCESVLATVPDEANALHILGIVRLRQGDAQGAVGILQSARRRDPANPEISTNLGAALRAAGHPKDAARLLRKSVRRTPASVSAHLNLANALADTGEAELAERHYRRVLQLAPSHAGALGALGRLLADGGRHGEALACFEALAAIDPDDAATLNAIGALHAGAGDFGRAGTALRRALELDPGNIDIAANLANVLACQFRYADAQPLYARILDASPESPDLLSDAANGHVRGGNDGHAADCFRRALAIDPLHPDANAGLANFLLARGQYDEGWSAYLHRSSISGMGPGLHRGALPADLSGRRICVVADQGLGDEIFFLRFASALRRRGATVSYRPEPRLAGMLGRAGIVDTILSRDDIPRGDRLLAVGDLPHVLGMGDGDAPPPTISLTALAENRARLLARLRDFGPGPWIGATWRAGTPNLRRLLFKEIDRNRLADALAGAPGSIVVVQRGATADEVAGFADRLGRPVLDLSAVNDDLEDMLALSGLLDRYVAVSNTMVHLRAACGKTSDVLVPAPADFRWMASGDESPWFPGSRVYRQSFDGDWTAALSALAARLRP